MSRGIKTPFSPDAVFSTSFFYKTSESFKAATQNSSGNDLSSAMAAFPEFFYPCEIRHRNIQRARITSEGVKENYPRDIEGWYKSEFGIK